MRLTRRQIEPPINTKQWAKLCQEDPAGALVVWLERHEGEHLEVDGPNRGPWLRSVLLGGDGLPYCADIILSFLHAIDGPLPLPFRAGAHWYWHNRSVDNLERAHKRGGTWCGPASMPQPKQLVFWEDRSGSDPPLGRKPRRHVDVVSWVRPHRGEICLIGANVANRIKSRTVKMGHPRITGFGTIAEPRPR